MRQPPHDRMMTIAQFRDQVAHHMQRLQAMRRQRYILLQQTQEQIITTQHTIAVSKLLLQDTSKLVGDERLPPQSGS